MDKSLLEKAKSYFMGGRRALDPLAEELGDQPAKDGGVTAATSAPSSAPPSTEASSAAQVPVAEPDVGIFESSNSLARSLIGSVATVGDYHFPVDLIGGCCPRVMGEEQDVVWNAAAEASDSERVHVIWSAQKDRIWYLAVRSSDMSSYQNTWCPFASLLPGMKDAGDPPTVYTYFSDEAATMMTVLVDGLQIHRGTSSVVRAKAERVSRELNNAPIIELVPDRVAVLTPVPWFSLSLFEDRARRILAAFAVASAIVFAGVAILIWFVAAMATVSAHADIKEIQARSERKSLEILKKAQEQRTSPMREQLAKFADVNDGLLSLDGYLEMYQITGAKATWRAVLPQNVTSDRINELGGKTLDNSAQGVIVGNSNDALNLGKGKK